MEEPTVESTTSAPEGKLIHYQLDRPRGPQRRRKKKVRRFIKEDTSPKVSPSPLFTDPTILGDMPAPEPRPRQTDKELAEGISPNPDIQKFVLETLSTSEAPSTAPTYVSRKPLPPGFKLPSPKVPTSSVDIETPVPSTTSTAIVPYTGSTPAADEFSSVYVAGKTPSELFTISQDENTLMELLRQKMQQKKEQSPLLLEWKQEEAPLPVTTTSTKKLSTSTLPVGIDRPLSTSRVPDVVAQRLALKKHSEKKSEQAIFDPAPAAHLKAAFEKTFDKSSEPSTAATTFKEAPDFIPKRSELYADLKTLTTDFLNKKRTVKRKPLLNTLKKTVGYRKKKKEIFVDNDTLKQAVQNFLTNMATSTHKQDINLKTETEHKKDFENFRDSAQDILDLLKQ